MKKVLAVFATTFVLASCSQKQDDSSAVEASRFAKPDANLFSCTTADGLNVNYMPSNISGKRTFDINSSCGTQGQFHCGAIINLLNAEDSQVTVKAQKDAISVSGSRDVPDFSSTQYTLIIPAPDLQVGPNEVKKFSSTLITNTQKESIAGPVGQMKIETSKVSCEARFVMTLH